MINLLEKRFEGNPECSIAAMATIALAIDPKAAKSGESWLCRCPCHDDTTPSLSIRSGIYGPLFKCFAGCPSGHIAGWCRDNGIALFKERIAAPAPQKRPEDKKGFALSIWNKTKPALGKRTEKYLQSRAITDEVPADIRHLGEVKHPSGRWCPAMIALLRNGLGFQPLAIHRTFLNEDGTGKARLEPDKMMLGPCRGGAVMLDLYVPGQRLIVGEGIETCLSVRQTMKAHGHDCAVWAALSTSGLRGLNLPPSARAVLIAADADEAGESAAQFAARRWIDEGRSVRVARPLKPFSDFNDFAMARIASKGGAK